MSDMPREPAPDDAVTSRFPPRRSAYDPADDPVTGAPAGTADAYPADAEAADAEAADTESVEAGSADAEAADTESVEAGSADAYAAGRASVGARAGVGAGSGRSRRRLLSFGPAAGGGPLPPRERRRRRFFAGGIVAGAALIVVALCVGGFAVVSAVHGLQGRAADAREARRLREDGCLELENRLNRLNPPGATTGPAARAKAIRDENSAVRLYVDQLHRQRDEDGWRQLLDARTVYADALDRQASARTPAFYVAPRTADGRAVVDELTQWSPAPCAGPIRRLAVPEL